MEVFVHTLKSLPQQHWSQAGGKAATLAQLTQAGYPVPEGFVLLPTAFIGEELLAEAWQQVKQQLDHMRKGHADIRFAVRSSAALEDSERASFAGAFETVLDVASDQAIREAIDTVRTSYHGARVAAYSQAQGLVVTSEGAIVVQRMIRAELAGVLFTADPLTGSRARLIANMVQGRGEHLVAGEANPEHAIWQRRTGDYEGPDVLKPFAATLYRLACRLEKVFKGPQDIEWAVARGKVYLLQSRPITTLKRHKVATGEYNDSLAGDYLWTSTNFSEAISSIMTPSTWSLLQILFFEHVLIPDMRKWPYAGNICGRPYVNVSLVISAFCATGMKLPGAIRQAEALFGRLPEGAPIEVTPLLTRADILELLPLLPEVFRTFSHEDEKFAAFRTEAPGWCAGMEQRIQDTGSGTELASLWREEVRPFVSHALWMMLRVGQSFERPAGKLRLALEQLVGEADANLLLSHTSNEAELLTSLGPVWGLASVAQGKMSREEYLERYGFRGLDEFELSAPRPSEEPGWLERQLAQAVNVEDMLAQQQAASNDAWQRFRARYPRLTKAMCRRLDQFAADARRREGVRAETIRVVGVVRQFALRAGTLTGLDEAIFFLALDEMIEVLHGNPSTVQTIPARRETHARYSALPRYPAAIYGHFDPFQWAADPQRRTDFFSTHATLPASDAETISGIAGSAGRTEGRVRCLRTPEEGEQLQPGEILVTMSTNIGWTLLFPRAAALITDVGAPLSHTVIVARELGIPAVVGCGNAVARLHTGDLVQVDGGQGIIKILEHADLQGSKLQHL